MTINLMIGKIVKSYPRKFSKFLHHDWLNTEERGKNWHVRKNVPQNEASNDTKYPWGFKLILSACVLHM